LRTRPKLSKEEKYAVPNGTDGISLLSQASERTTLAMRGRVAKTPYFPRNISCLAPILGESGDLGGNPGWEGDGKMTTIPNEFRES